MKNFSIKDIELLSGIKAHTFRIWEQRHGLCFCKRKVSLHRYFDNEDLKSVLRVSYLYHLGFKISKIAHLSNDEIIKLASKNIEKHKYHLCVHQMMEASLDYDQQKFEDIIQNAILSFGIEECIFRIFYPFLEKIGLLWITEHIVPAQEHMSSGVILKKLLVAIDRLESAANTDCNDMVLIFSPEGERHEIPLLVALYNLKKHNIKTIYFGVNVSMQQLKYYCHHKKVTHFYFHLITGFLYANPNEYLNILNTQFPEIRIVASGPAFKNVTPPANVKIVNAVKEFLNVFDKIA